MSLRFAFKIAGGDVFVRICPQPMILYAGLGGFNVDVRGCSFTQRRICAALQDSIERGAGCC